LLLPPPPPFLANISFVSSSADAKPLLSDDMGLPLPQGVKQFWRKNRIIKFRKTGCHLTSDYDFKMVVQI
jgi:hypothetical protein